MRPLLPSLASIEHAFSGVSDELILRIARDDRDVSPDLRKAAESDSESRQAIDGLRKREIEGVRLAPDWDRQDVPDHMADCIRRRVAAAATRFSPVPKAGQIISVEKVVGPQGALDWDLARPLAVLIDRPAVAEDGSRSDTIWYGWMVAPETDYATYWDLVLEADDEPMDPLAGMVQLWNPVHIYLPSGQQVLGELNATRLGAVRSVAAEYLTAPEPEAADARPGFVALRTTIGGFRVLTGTPLSGNNDPRWRYQELYHTAAEAIRIPARLAAAAAPNRESPQLAAGRPSHSILGLAAALHTRISEWAQSIGSAFTLQPLPHMLREAAEEERVPSYSLDNLIEITFKPQPAVLQVLVRLVSNEKGAIRLAVIDDTGTAWEEQEIGEIGKTATFLLEMEQLAALRITDAVGKILYEIPLKM